MRKKIPTPLRFVIISSTSVLALFLVSLPALATQSGLDSSTPTSDNPLDLFLPITPSAAATLISSTQTAPVNPTSTFTTSQFPTDYFMTTSIITASSILTPTETSTPFPTQFSFLPNLIRDFYISNYTPTPTPTPPEVVLFCDNLSQPLYIPDNYPPGVNNAITITDQRLLVDLRLYLNISHSYVGDLVVSLSNLNTQKSITAINRPASSQYHCAHDDIVTILGDAAAQPVDNKCAAYPNAISGIYRPSQSLQVFTGQPVSGTWRLNVSDNYTNDTGAINHWCLEAKVSETMPAPTPSPTPVNLPPSANVGGMSGQDQQVNLDCESRSAVDWAKHYGFNIDEIHFLNNLPRSDDPEVGFVGNPDGVWGNIPPNDYGVHAAPIAELLRDYGLTAESVKSLSWDGLKAQIASGNPVIVWIIGDNSLGLVNGTPRYYTASSTHNLLIVSRYEHTVIVVGYSSSSVTILNGSHFKNILVDQFLDSWSALDFMAVIAKP
jgi:subtilisin-like proprotein convertase family protein/uncharacterized protein YvpB